jgi:hypothetical protein
MDYETPMFDFSLAASDPAENCRGTCRAIALPLPFSLGLTYVPTWQLVLGLCLLSGSEKTTLRALLNQPRSQITFTSQIGNAAADQRPYGSGLYRRGSLSVDASLNRRRSSGAREPIVFDSRALVAFRSIPISSSYD